MEYAPNALRRRKLLCSIWRKCTRARVRRRTALLDRNYCISYPYYLLAPPSEYPYVYIHIYIHGGLYCEVYSCMYLHVRALSFYHEILFIPYLSTCSLSQNLFAMDLLSPPLALASSLFCRKYLPSIFP